MQTQSLTVRLRQEHGKGVARKLRAAGKIPGVVYGQGKEARPVSLDRKTFDQLLRSGGGHGVLDLSFEDSPEMLKALVREVQVHPVSRAVEHVDLQTISMQERIRLEVPIVLLGKPEGVRTQGGILEHNLRNIEIECLPGDIPPQIELDVSAMQVGQALHVSDLHLPGIIFVAHAETSIATVSLPAAERAHEEEAAVATEAGEAAEGEAKAGEKGEDAGKSEKGQEKEKEKEKKKGGQS